MATASLSCGRTINGTGSLNHSDDSKEPEGDSSDTQGQEAMWPSESPLPLASFLGFPCTRHPLWGGEVSVATSGRARPWALLSILQCTEQPQQGAIAPKCQQCQD